MHTNYRRGETKEIVRRLNHKYSNIGHRERHGVKEHSDRKLRQKTRQWLHNQQWDYVPDPLPQEVDDRWHHD